MEAESSRAESCRAAAQTQRARPPPCRQGRWEAVGRFAQISLGKRKRILPTFAEGFPAEQNRDGVAGAVRPKAPAYESTEGKPFHDENGI